jgi:hypothetical protein
MVIARFSGNQSARSSEADIRVKKHQYEDMVFRDIDKKYSIGYFTKCNFQVVEYSNLALKEHFYTELQILREENELKDLDIFE